jgi:arylformamidase
MYVDLSVAVNEKTPVYPGDAPVKIESAAIFERDGWTDHIVSVNTHVGTHMDAPLHMIKDGKTLDQIPLDQCTGRGLIVPAEKDITLDAVKRAGIQEGDIVLFRTGMSERYHEPIYFEKYPVMPEAVAHYLVEQKVKMVGVDTGSVDNADHFPIHKILLGGGVLIIENLTNLDKLPSGPCKIYALPMKLELDGASARVIAEV